MGHMGAAMPGRLRAPCLPDMRRVGGSTGVCLCAGDGAAVGPCVMGESGAARHPLTRALVLLPGHFKLQTGLQGYGRMAYADGSWYEGNWHEGCKHGYGYMWWSTSNEAHQGIGRHAARHARMRRGCRPLDELDSLACAVLASAPPPAAQVSHATSDAPARLTLRHRHARRQSCLHVDPRWRCPKQI